MHRFYNVSLGHGLSVLIHTEVRFLTYFALGSKGASKNWKFSLRKPVWALVWLQTMTKENPERSPQGPSPGPEVVMVWHMNVSISRGGIHVWTEQWHYLTWHYKVGFLHEDNGLVGGQKRKGDQPWRTAIMKQTTRDLGLGSRAAAVVFFKEEKIVGMCLKGRVGRIYC